jgi:hypothetical protein
MSITAIARQAQGIHAGEVMPSSLKKLTSFGSTTESTNLLQLSPATMKLLVAAPTTVLTVLELTSQPSQTVAAPTPADLHCKTAATEKLFPAALRQVAAATTPTAAAATAAAPTMGPTGGLGRRQLRPREQPRLRRLTRRVRRPPED